MKTVAIDPVLHRYLKMLGALRLQGLNELIEPRVWELVRENRERLETALGEPVQIPEPSKFEVSSSR